MAKNINKEIKKSRDIGYLSKDFDSLRRDLVTYASTHYSDKIKDFSEVGLGGLFVDMAAYVGDVLSFYLDHQFNELSLETAIEEENVERLIRNSGIEITGASPSFATVTCFVRVPAILEGGIYKPNIDYLPTIRAGTKLRSKSGVNFELISSLDFAERNLKNNELVATFSVGNTNQNGQPSDFIVYADGVFSSSATGKESFTIGASHVPFRTISLSKNDISEIISIFDSEGNEYYEVDSLAQDVVFKRVTNLEYDAELVPESLSVLSAPRRFTSSMSRKTGKTTVRFGSGRSDTYDDDIIPNPSDHALPLYGEKRTFKKFKIDPNKLLETQTLGVSPLNTTLTVRYRYGGGFDHNVESGQITEVSTLLTKFNASTPASVVRSVRDSFEVYNELAGSGGTDRPTLEDLRTVALAYQGSQNRIVTQQDLLTRVYTMPASLGRVYRIGVRKNPINPNSVLLSVVTKNAEGKLGFATDSLKKNIATYINEFRLISDTLEILDAGIVNFAVVFSINTDARFNHNNVISKVLTKLKERFKVDSAQIDRPINLTAVQKLITDEDGVLTLTSFDIVPRAGLFEGRVYSEKAFNKLENTKRGLLFPPRGGIFELKFPDDDLIGKVN